MHEFHRSRRAFTMLELGVVLLIAVLAVAILLPAFGGSRCRGSRQVKDSSQIRGVLQGLVVWAQNNQEHYPVPGTLDKDNATTAEVGSAKNHTANILSVMVFNGFVPPDLLVSPAESNGNITPNTSYEFNNPSKAAAPTKALWDPAFSVDFTKGQGGTSYAMNPASASRISTTWNSTFDPSEPVVGNRGPQVTGVTYNGQSATPTVANPDSNTYLIHGGRTTWEGNIGFNDNHVDFMTDYLWKSYSPVPKYATTGGQLRTDVPFFDEPDDAKETNAFLGIFTTAGDSTKDFNAIWD